MEIVITPDYSDLFNEDRPAIETLLKKISSKEILGYLAYINAQLFSRNRREAENEILSFFSSGISEDQREHFDFNLKKIREKNRPQQVSFFSVLASMEFIHYELCNFKGRDDYEPRPSERFNFLKSYFVIVEDLANRNKEAIDPYCSIEEDFFRTRTWPLLSEQFGANYNSDIVINLLRGFTFFKYFEMQSSYVEYVDCFLKKNGEENSWHYLRNIMDLLQVNWNNQDFQSIRPFFLRTDKNEIFLENLAIDIPVYQASYMEEKSNFNGIKKTPLVKTKENTYLVLNWDYLSNKSYEGLVFDFYNDSGIKSVFKSFLDFKNHISYQVTEQYIFRRLLAAIFQEKYSTLNFFGDEEKGMPDAYYRRGKYIYLFEIKDAYFPASVLGSYSYEKIKNAIDKKYNTTSKGTGQILKQLEKLKDRPFERRSYDDLRLKPRNVVVYPILVYTDLNFGMAGFNNYLKEEFEAKVNSQELDKHFSQIKDLSFISLSFFIENINNLRKKELRFYLDDYHSYIRASEKRHNRYSDLASMFSMNNNLENYFTQVVDSGSKVEKNYLKNVFEALDLPQSSASVRN